MHIINLQTFIVVSRIGGFHAAAERLNITQAAVSARIKALEDHLGQRLLDRGRNGAVLTVAGKELLPHAESITQTWNHAKSMLGVPASRPVMIRIGAQFSTWAQLVLDWATWISDSLPEAELDLCFDFSMDMQNAVKEGTLDIAVTYAATPALGTQALSLPDETMVLVAPYPASLSDGHLPPFIRLDWGPQFNSQVTRVERLITTSNLFIGQGELGLRYILEHDVCGYFPLRNIRQLLRDKRLYRVKRAPKFTIPGHIVYSNEGPNHLFVERAIEGLRGIRTNPREPQFY